MDLPPGITLSIQDKIAPDDEHALALSLEDFNEAAWPGHQPWSEFGIFLRDPTRIVGGLVGQVYAGWLFIRYFWLAEALRGRGLGEEFIALAEAKAVAAGCHGAYLDTFTFQAPGFYARLGYVEFARLPYPPRGDRIWLRKTLAQPPFGT